MIQRTETPARPAGAQLAGARKNCPAGDEVEVPLGLMGSPGRPILLHSNQLDDLVGLAWHGFAFDGAWAAAHGLLRSWPPRTGTGLDGTC